MEVDSLFTILSRLGAVFTLGKLIYNWLKKYKGKKTLERELAQKELDDLKAKLEALLIENSILKTIKESPLQAFAEKNEHPTEDEILFHNVFFSVDFLANVHEVIEEIFKNTRADRFLIIFAVNGKTDFNYVTACYEMGINNNVVGATKRYKKFEIDPHYRSMLKQIQVENMIIYDVEQMEDCLLKTVYQSPAEKVKHSIIKFISRIKINSHNDAVVYISIATKNTEPYPKNELILIKYNSDQITKGAKDIIII